MNSKIIASVKEVKEVANVLDDSLSHFAKLVAAVLTWLKWMRANSNAETELPNTPYATVFQHVQEFRWSWHALQSELAIIALQGEDDDGKFKRFYEAADWLYEYVNRLVELTEMTDENNEKFREVTGWHEDPEHVVVNMHIGLSNLTDELNYLKAEIG
jgi:hypothetical protein